MVIARWIGLATLLLLAPAAVAETTHEQSTSAFPAAGIASLRIENARGVISVSRSPDSQVHVTALKVVRSKDPKWAQKMSEGTEVVTERRGDEFVIRVAYPQRSTVSVRFWDLFGDFEMPKVEMRLAVDVPAGIAISLKSTSGDISTADLNAALRIESTSGDVLVTNASAVMASSTSGDIRVRGARAVRVHTVSGDVALSQLGGPLLAETTSGDLTIRGAADSVRVRSVSGDLSVDDAARGATIATTSGEVTVRRAAGRVEVESASGDIGVTLVAPLLGADVGSTSGDVTLRLADGMPCALDLSTSSGEIEVSMPLDMQRVTRHKVQGTVRKGKTPVHVRTASGDINITEGVR